MRKDNEMESIYNYLDHLTLEDYIKFAAQGYEIEIHAGHVVSMKKVEKED